MQRDLKAELKQLSENPSITKLMELAEEAVDRAIVAMAKNTESYDLLYNAFDKVKGEAEQLKQDNAALREENDSQRDSIQKLSCQIVAHQEVITVIKNSNRFVKLGYNGPELEGYHVSKEDMEKLKNILSSPDPGTETRERIEKLEAVAKATKEFMDMLTEEYGDCVPDPSTWKYESEIHLALARLEGVGE